jgi:hypothetical protein
MQSGGKKKKAFTLFDKIKEQIGDNLMAGLYELELLNSLNAMKMEVLKNLL